MKKILLIFLLIPVGSFAQTDDAFSLETPGVDNLQEGSSIEENGEDELQDSELDAILSGSDDSEPSVEQAPRKTKREEIPETPSDLGRLIPYEDIAVIQRRFLPKSGRFEVAPIVGLVSNNAFYLLSSYGLTFGYNFTEHWGIEASGAYVHNSLKRVTKDLANKQVSIATLLYPAYFYDVSVKYSPIYGKLGFFKSKILPFDMYFSLGVGQNVLDQILDVNKNTTVRNQKISSIKPINLKIGTGMVFAISKNMAFKWDASWRLYAANNREVVQKCPEVMARMAQGQTQGQTPQDEGGTIRVGGSGAQNFGCPEAPISYPWWPPGGEVYITIGFSFFFPDAGYR